VWFLIVWFLYGLGAALTVAGALVLAYAAITAGTLVLSALASLFERPGGG